MSIQRKLLATLATALGLTSGMVDPAGAQLYINEIFFNPGGQGRDDRDEYIELRGTPNFVLDNHYLILLENELDEVGLGEAGEIEFIFDLNGRVLGSNGFLVFRQKGSMHSVAPGTTDLVNVGEGVGFGSGAGSSIGASSLLDIGQLGNSGFTAMLIRDDGELPPYLAFDLDVGNDGLDSVETAVDGWRSKWEILDSVGFFAEADETEFGRLYGQVNFGVDDPGFPLPPSWTPPIEPGATFELVDFELEYIGRWGNSTGQTPDDWHATNLTDNFGSGYIQNSFLFRQSGDPHSPNDNDPLTPPNQPGFLESSKAAPYGTVLTGSLGAPNYIQGDYNKDGVVDAADYTVWRDTIGATSSDVDAAYAPADANNDYVVDDADYYVWKGRFGEPGAGPMPASAAGSSGAVPEPGGLSLASLAAVGLGLVRRR